jgi:uncharacterized protein YjbI with pentapeptide repeats
MKYQIRKTDGTVIVESESDTDTSLIDLVERNKDKLAGANLKWKYLNGANLSRANFRGAVMTRITTTRSGVLDRPFTNMSGADLSNADLMGADMVGTNLSSAEMVNVNLVGGNLSRVDLRNANLSGSNLTGVNLKKAKLKGATLNGVNLTGANLQLADLRDVDLSGANLTGANLVRVQLDGANLTRAILDRADVACSEMAKVNLTGASLKGTDLTNTILVDSDLTGADLTEAVLAVADLAGTNLTNVKGLVKILKVKPENTYWKKIGPKLVNNGYQFKLGLNELKPGEVFADDERVENSYPSFGFANSEWFEDESMTPIYPDRPYKALVRIPLDAKINEPWSTDGQASADKIEILQVFEVSTGKDVTERFRKP